MKTGNIKTPGIAPTARAFAVTSLVAAAAFFVTTSHAAPPDHAAFKAAAEACGLPKPGEGRPTEEQKACMEKAGFSHPKGPRGPRGEGGQRPPPPPESESSTTEGSSRGTAR